MKWEPRGKYAMESDGYRISKSSVYGIWAYTAWANVNKEWLLLDIKETFAEAEQLCEAHKAGRS